MTQKEFRERNIRAKKCVYCIDFFGIKFCFFHSDENTVQNDPFKIKAPLCTDLKKCAYDEWKENLRRTIQGEKEMAKNFGKAGSAKTFESVGKQSAEKARVITIKMIPNEKIHDYPFNREDISDTTDLENSINQIGFIDPVVLTSGTTYENLKKQRTLLKAELEGLQEAKKDEFERIKYIKATIEKIDVVLSELGSNEDYMLVSGHRRRCAGVKTGLNDFPSIIREFDTIEEIENYVLLANSQRDSAKDPLLFCRRYKMHEEYLISIGFKGNIRDEIAKRLGISKSHADRYNTMNKIIFPVWDMVRDELVGMSSVLPMASHDEDEQLEIYNIMQGALTDGKTLTRDVVKQIIFDYREGKKIPEENTPEEDTVSDIGIPSTSVINTVLPVVEAEQEPQEIVNENEESEVEEEALSDIPLPGQRTFDDFASDEQSDSKSVKELFRALDKLDKALSEDYSFADRDEASKILVSMQGTFENVINQMYDIARTNNLNDEFVSAVSALKDKIEDFQ